MYWLHSGWLHSGWLHSGWLHFGGRCSRLDSDSCSTAGSTLNATMMRKDFSVNSFPLPQRKPSLVPELACTMRITVNAIHRSVPLRSAQVFKTIPSWTRRLLAETASTRNLFLQNESRLDAWNCGPSMIALRVGPGSLLGMITIDCPQCVFNTSGDVTSRFVASSILLKRVARQAFCTRVRLLFGQRRLGFSGHLARKQGAPNKPMNHGKPMNLGGCCSNQNACGAIMVAGSPSRKARSGHARAGNRGRDR